MDNEYLDLYFIICFVIAGIPTAFLCLVAVLFGLVLFSVILIPMFLVAIVTDTYEMIYRGLRCVFK
jgi:hypothetical protein